MLAAALCACVLAVTIGGLGVVAAVLGAHRARAVADLAAVGGAAGLLRGADPAAACATASALASRDGAAVSTCTAQGQEVRVTVVVRTARGLPDAVARARAGPPGS